MSLIDRMSGLFNDVKRQRRRIKSEVATIQVSIMPFIQELGYNTRNLDEVYPEYSVGGGWVDFAILRNRKPIIFIEVKLAGEDLSKPKHRRQLGKYYDKGDVKFGILTNGIKYHFYTDIEKPNQMDIKPFHEIDTNLIFDKNLTYGLLKRLTKSCFNSQQAVTMAIISKSISQVPDNIKKELNKTEPNSLSDKFIRQLIKKEYPKHRLNQAVMEEFTPTIENAFSKFVRKTAPTAQDATVSLPRPRMKIPVFARYKRQRYEAILFFNLHAWRKSRVEFEGEMMSPSAAGKCLKLSINSKLNQPSPTGGTDGWRFWKLIGLKYKKGRPIPIGDLRKNKALRRRLLGTD